MKLKDFTLEMLQKAIEIYLSYAYRNEQQIPLLYQENLKIIEELESFEDFLEANFVEKIYSDMDKDFVVKYQFRLGNDKFKHMKLGIERIGESEEFIFEVNVHDEVLDKLSKLPNANELMDFEAYLALKEHNRTLKAKIEKKWTENELPTFLNFKKEKACKVPDTCESKGKTILIVDDEISIREILKLAFSNNGYDVFTAKNGQEALKLIRKYSGQIDCCLLDVMMDEVNGFDVLRTIKIEKHDPFDIFILTGMAPENLSDEIKKMVEKVIYKPFDFEELVEVVDKNCFPD